MTAPDSFNDNDVRGPYYYASGSRYVDEVYEGSKVIGRWIREDFRPAQVLWWKPRFSIEKEHIAQLENGEFAVRKKGMNDCWYDSNSGDVVFESFEEASRELVLRVELVNAQCFKRSLSNLIIQIVVLAFFITLLILYI